VTSDVYRSTLRILACLDRYPLFRLVNRLTRNALPPRRSAFSSVGIDTSGAPTPLVPGDEVPSDLHAWFREDVVTQNQLTLVTVLDDGGVNRVRAVMSAIDSYATRLATPGSLIGISTIHFVRWLVIDNGRRLMMVSDYDGSWESYIDEFAEMILSGLDAIWETARGYPPDGAADLPAFKRFLRTHQVPAEVFFSAYPRETILNIANNGLGTNAITYVRANNTIGYFLPSNLGGLYGQAQVSAQEGGAVNGNKQFSGRLGYAAGPFNVALSYGSTDSLQGAVEQKYKHGNIAGSWNFGFLNLMAQWDKLEAGAREQKTYLIGTVVPLGQGEFKFAYSKADQSGAGFDGADADQIAVGYVYNLSKRTAMYGHLSRIKNKNALAAFAISGGAGSAANDTSRGVEVGLRHSF